MLAMQKQSVRVRGCAQTRVPAYKAFTSSAVRRSNLMLKAELKVGDNLSDYPDYYRVLKTSTGTSLALASYKGKQPLVLFFYPKAGTPGCTKEACKFRDEFSRFKAAGVEVLGLSSDSPAENKAFAEAQRLQFPLVTDENGFLRKSFGIKSDLLGLLPGRQTYVIDINGKCILSFNDQLNAEKHVDEALAALKAVKV